MELPFLVVHGAWLWMVVLLGLIGATYAIVWAVRTRRARRRGYREVAGRLARATAPAEGEVTLAGTLRGGTLSMIERHGQRAHHASDALWLDCGGTRIDLPDGIVMIRGAHERRGSRPPPGTPQELEAAMAGDGVIRDDYSLQTISDGDEVTVTGTLAPRPADGAGYREGAVAWTLDGTATIASVAPHAVPVRYHPIARVAFAAIVSFGWYGVLYQLGQHALDKSAALERQGLAFTPERLAGAGWLQLASALPRSRAQALQDIAYAADERRERSERGLRFAELVETELGRGCNVSRAFEDERWEAALATARACKNSAAEVRALQYLGEYALASSHAGNHLDSDVVVAIATGQWKRAAELAEALASDNSSRQVVRLRCLAALFRHHAGERPAYAAPVSDPMCAIVNALQQPVEQRQVTLERLQIDDAGLALLDDTLLRVHGGASSRSSVSVPVVEVVTSGHRLPWLSRFITDAESELDRFALQLLIDPQQLGDYQRIPLTRDQQLHDYSNRIAIALVTGAALPSPVDPAVDDRRSYIHPALKRMVTLRRGQPSPDFILTVRPSSCEQPLADAVAAAQRGDGRPLANVLRACRISGGYLDQLLIGVLPLVKTERPALAESLRFVGFRSSFYNYPFDLIVKVARRRNIARLVGDEPEAQRWQRTLERLVAPLADRDRAIALHLWADRD